MQLNIRLQNCENKKQVTQNLPNLLVCHVLLYKTSKYYNGHSSLYNETNCNILYFPYILLTKITFTCQLVIKSFCRESLRLILSQTEHK